MLSNYPMWLLDEGTTEPQYPIIDFNFATQKNVLRFVNVAA